MLRLRKNKPGFFEQLESAGNILSPDDRTSGLNFLIHFFNHIRPASEKAREAEINLSTATQALKKSQLALANFQHAVLAILKNTKLTSAITESGIPLSRGFWQELSNRLKHKLLPPLVSHDDFLYIIQQIFYKKTDFQWVEAVPRNVWVSFFETIGFDFSISGVALKKELLHALNILSYQVAQLGLERNIVHFLPENSLATESPFVTQNRYVLKLQESSSGDEQTVESAFAFSQKLKNEIKRCYELIEYIRDSHSVKGASIQQTYILLMLTNRLQRIQLILDILDADTEFDTGRFVDIFRMLVRNENRKNSIREFLSQGLGYLAYQIAEHKKIKGHQYITETRSEFFKMIYSAMWGGFIISFIAIVKNLIGKLMLAPFPLGFLYSVNYSIGFILIEETKSTLATKQPAFTASALASSLDPKKNEGEPDLEGLASTIAKVSRSQIASFFGNLVVVFPMTFLLAWLYSLVFGKPIAEGEAAFKLIRDQHPWHSASLLYACFTGVFLFLSGIIAGYWQNKIRFGQIRERIVQHPFLKRNMSLKARQKLASYIEKHSGAIMGNLALGFFLGFSGVIGKIFGIPFDIRHITIAAGNMMVGVQGYGLTHLPPYFLLAVFFGVLGIGFLNFLVSFMLAFFMAVKSRGIHLTQYPQLFSTIKKYIRSHPREFFLPPPTAETYKTEFRSLKKEETPLS
ncbi:MAG: site-specific recombinase [Chitinophagaceae bacterium]|nr:site-specific recombinase [Chitinophagaceae bacterium]